MRVASVHFERPIPVLGTSERKDHFDAADGWLIDVRGLTVSLHRPARPEQNVREVPSFFVTWVGFCAPITEPHVPEQTDVPRDVSSDPVAATGDVGPDAGGAPEAPQPTESRKARAKRLR